MDAIAAGLLQNLERPAAPVAGSDALLAAAAAAAADAIGALSAERDGIGRIVDFVWATANPAAERLFGGPWLAGRRLAADAADGGCAGLLPLLAEAVASGAAVRRTLPAGPGHWRVAAAPLADGVSLCVAPVATAPMTIEEPLRRALDHSSESFALFDADGRLVFANERLRAFFPEIAPALLPGARFEDLLRRHAEADPLAPPAGPEREAWIRRRMERHRAPDRPFTFRTPEGRWLLTSEQPTPDGGTICIHTDVTGLKATEQELRASEAAARAARHDADRANRAKSEFLTHMSHELRTPLNAVLGFAQLMVEEAMGPLGNPRYKAYARDIQDSGVHLLALIDDVLDLSRIEAGRLELAVEATDAADAATFAARFVREKADRRGVQLTLDVPGEPVALMADVRALRQMIINLVSNAVKFTPQGGQVLVSVSRLPDGGVGVMVADTGVGIRPEELDLVMEPFGRAAGFTANAAGGTGLGLPIVKRLMELHGGRLELTSDQGAGVTAVLLFPPARSLPDTLFPPSRTTRHRLR